MPMESRAGVLAAVLPKAVVAALVGSVAGGIAGVWSLRRPAASVNAAAPTVSAASPVATPSATTRTKDDGAGSLLSTSVPKRIAPTPQPTPVLTNAAAPPADDDASVLQRARTLAQRPDVTALIALREDVVRRARERGIAGSPSVKGELNELDLRLNEARTLQLKLDAEAFRKADSKPPR
jgi:hypothetical protein